MKTKLFLAAMAAVAVIGCQKEPAGSIVNLDGDASYLKVDFNAAGSLTKAPNEADDFEYGEETENSVSSIHFYFFNSAGAPYIRENLRCSSCYQKKCTGTSCKDGCGIERYRS